MLLDGTIIFDHSTIYGGLSPSFGVSPLLAGNAVFTPASPQSTGEET